MLVFFGDPETKGVGGGCARLPRAWRSTCSSGSPSSTPNGASRGIEKPFRARMGINTGFCNVGNFGSDDRMDYTIIGAEANLAARLQSIAEPGGIVLSYETYALVRDIVRAHPLPPITMKGISREVVPYAVDGLVGEIEQRAQVISEHATGVDIFLDLDAMDEKAPSGQKGAACGGAVGARQQADERRAGGVGDGRTRQSGLEMGPPPAATSSLMTFQIHCRHART